jgi:hypothetical protein
MTYLLLDDGMDAHRKIEGLSDRSFRLHLCGLFHCARNLTDGLVSDVTVRGLCARLRATPKHVTELVEIGLWVAYPGRGFIVNNYLEWNPSRVDVEERRRKRSESGRAGGLRSVEARREASASLNGEASA